MEKMLKDYWNGKYPLVQSYWIGCILIPIILLLPLAPAFSGNVSDGYAMFAIFWWGVMFFANGYLLIGGFKSASIYVADKRKKKQNAGWGIAAQILIVIGGIRIVLEYAKVFAS